MFCLICALLKCSYFLHSLPDRPSLWMSTWYQAPSLTFVWVALTFIVPEPMSNSRYRLPSRSSTAKKSTWTKTKKGFRGCVLSIPFVIKFYIAVKYECEYVWTLLRLYVKVTLTSRVVASREWQHEAWRRQAHCFLLQVIAWLTWGRFLCLHLSYRYNPSALHGSWWWTSCSAA